MTLFENKNHSQDNTAEQNYDSYEITESSSNNHI